MERWARSTGVVHPLLLLPVPLPVWPGAEEARLLYEHHCVKCHSFIPAMPGTLKEPRQRLGTAIRPHRSRLDIHEMELLLEYWQGAREQNR